MSHIKNDGDQPPEKATEASENLSGWADQFAQTAQSLVNGLNAAVLAEDQQEAFQKAKTLVKPE
jgi:hypothetical protein